MEKLGLTAENTDLLIDDIQKKHAYQFCDNISDILDELNDKDYDQNKIQEIKFDLDKIKRDIESLKIQTQGDLKSGIARIWAKIKLADIGKYILDKTVDGTVGKLIGDTIEKFEGI